MRDFTIKIFRHLLLSFKKNAYSFSGFSSSVEYPRKKNVIIRHDVDRLPYNSLKIAHQ